LGRATLAAHRWAVRHEFGTYVLRGFSCHSPASRSLIALLIAALHQPRSISFHSASWASISPLSRSLRIKVDLWQKVFSVFILCLCTRRQENLCGFLPACRLFSRTAARDKGCIPRHPRGLLNNSGHFFLPRRTWASRTRVCRFARLMLKTSCVPFFQTFRKCCGNRQGGVHRKPS